MVDWIVIGIVVVLAALAAGYVVKAKRSGRKCIGCPDGGSCGGACSACGGSCGTQGKACGEEKNP